ncbi:zona pellucida sperm-binding protein 3-like [Trichomycterus rosablanca]|uniref:zona pellucida sperm-binding protein 3-like n=1 Tax=Trichomycterus rosablanca TaxID=2290929 RepID=UPI002F354BD2
MSFLWPVVFVVGTAVFAANKVTDIDVDCRKDSVVVKWKVNKNLAEKPSSLLLGDCSPLMFAPDADGGGEAIFSSGLSDCHFKQTRTTTKVIYENNLTFRPLLKPNSALFTYPIQCVFERSEGMQPFVKPAFVVWQNQGDLIFHMGLLNNNLSGPALSNFFPFGSFINIWAAVEQQAHQPLMLYLEECVASTALTLGAGSWTHPIIANKGCLIDGKNGYSRFLPRFESSSILLQLQSFKFAMEQEVYIHCKLVVWDPQDLNEEKKACNYDKITGEWELLDNPSQNDLCRCCDGGCKQRKTRSLHSAQAQRSVLGPLIIPASSSGTSERVTRLKLGT